MLLKAPYRVSRDPFTRETILRETVRLGIDTYHNTTCTWRGNTSDTPRTHHRRLFRYIVEADGIRPRRYTLKGLLCSIECMRTSHNGN